jgi:hypothetical protein
MPSVVAPGTQEGLIDGPAQEGLINYWLNILHGADSEHVVEGVVVVLEPEAVELLHIIDWLFGDLQAVGI